MFTCDFSGGKPSKATVRGIGQEADMAMSVWMVRERANAKKEKLFNSLITVLRKPGGYFLTLP